MISMSATDRYVGVALVVLIALLGYLIWSLVSRWRHKKSATASDMKIQTSIKMAFIGAVCMVLLPGLGLLVGLTCGVLGIRSVIIQFRSLQSENRFWSVLGLIV